MSSAISFNTRFCALVGLNGSSFLDLFPHLVGQLKLNPRQCVGCVSALISRPHSSQKNSSKINRYWDWERKSLRILTGVPAEGKCVSRTASVREGNQRCARTDSRQPVLQFRYLMENAVSQHPQHTGIHLADRVVNRDYAACMQSGIGIVLIAA